MPGSSTKCTDDACLTCAPDGSGAECMSPFGLDSSGQCIRCNVTGEHGDRCGRCNSDRPDFCLECAPIITQKVGNLGAPVQPTLSRRAARPRGSLSASRIHSPTCAYD